MRHFILVGILVIAATFLTHAGLDAAELMPVEASMQASEIDWMWDLQVIAMSFLFSLIVVPILYSLVVFRRKKGDTSDAEHIEGNTKLEIGWTIVPLVVVVVFSFLGAGNLARAIRPTQDAMVVRVTGFQWGWKFDYPDYRISTTELYLPVDRPVVFKLQSTDVIHSFWVPEFRVKQDLVPGRVTELNITPTLVTPAGASWKVRCAELCGTSHYSMEQTVRVVNEADFSTWVVDRQAEAAALNTPELRGQALAETNRCGACHSIDGSAGLAPTWFNLFGSTVELDNGTTVTADDAFLFESIKDPRVKVVAGYLPNMPVFPLTDEEISDLVAYIKTLR